VTAEGAARGGDRGRGNATAPWLDDFNRLGLDNAILAPLEPEYFLELARERTGLSEFGNHHFLGPLRLYLDALRAAPLSLIGRMIKAQEVLRLLENRLRIEDEIARNPDILEGVVERPVFIVSLPRAGSSILFELMACKQGVRAPRFWEAVEPSPPPELSTYGSDPRIRSTENAVEAWNRIVPAMRSRHLMAPDVPVECIQIQAFSFVSPQLMYGTTNYIERLTRDDYLSSYLYHKRVLQLLQYRMPGDRWLLKAPSHLSHLPELLSVYPDARIVFIHRDPVKVIASTVSTMATIHAIFGVPLDEEAYFRIYSKQAKLQIKNYMELGEKLLPAGSVIHVRYQDLMSSPLGTIDDIYRELGLPLQAPDRRAISDYWASRPSDGHGQHNYGIPPGIDIDSLRERYADYTTEFDIAAEDAPVGLSGSRENRS